MLPQAQHYMPLLLCVDTQQQEPLLLHCRDTLDALGGHYVLNSGTFLGPSKLLLIYINAMLEELQQRWHCRRLHGTDQAIHNFLVYTGKFIGTGTTHLCLVLCHQSKPSPQHSVFTIL